MKLPTPQVFSLQLKRRSTYAVTLDGGPRSGFTTPATLICPKIYVVTESKGIHYVGVTNRPMASRLNSGLKARGKGGYHGYRWKIQTKPLVLTVWSFTDRDGKDFIRELETVEAEFAYLVRKSTGQWPLSQTEIHFYKATTAHLKAVAAMLAHCTMLQDRTRANGRERC
jgi:hypothetical protein